MALLAPDAEVLEMGVRETRAEYSGKHLTADMEFARTVPTTRGPTIVRQEGDVAWVSTTGECKGMFHGKVVDTENTELMVLSRKNGQWHIRAVHWSGHTHRPET